MLWPGSSFGSVSCSRALQLADTALKALQTSNFSLTEQQQPFLTGVKAPEIFCIEEKS